MLWDALEESRVALTSFGADLVRDASAFLDACTLPLVVHDHHRAAVLGTATLVSVDGRPVLITAAHLFEGGVRFGNLLAPLADGHEFRSLAGARLACDAAADIAVIDFLRAPAARDLLHRRHAVPLHHAMPRRRDGRGTACAGRAMVCGYPAMLTRFSSGWLAARRLTLFTETRDESRPGSPLDHRFAYGHEAQRGDGTWARTPELEGMSGAGIWACEPEGHDAVRLRLAAVQSAYVHGRYLRGHDIGAVLDLLSR